MKMVAFLYGLIVYVLFFLGFLYLVGFVGDFAVPKSIDSGAGGPLARAIIVNCLLLGIFGAQHSVMARPWFKTRWTQLVPPVVERSTYVLFTTIALALIYWRWEPITREVWHVQNVIGRDLIWALFWLGWLIAFTSTLLISHFDLFGLRQVWYPLRGVEPEPVPFKKRFLYKIVRHPLMLGFLIAFWAAPTMTIGHLLFSLVMTAYIFLGVHFEERDLLAEHGETYAQYRREVRGVVPLPKGN
jgi:protein-S-isoprenylcysteine O-methyltransferase Ste14